MKMWKVLLFGLGRLVCFWACLGGCEALGDSYDIIVERSENGDGSIALVASGELLMQFRSSELPGSWISPGVYQGCSATRTHKTKKPAIYFPKDMVGRQGVFIRAGMVSNMVQGSIAVSEKAIEKLYSSITPKNGKNLRILVRSVDFSEAIQGTRSMISKVKQELQSAAESDKKNIRENLLLWENLLRLQELAETHEVIDDVVSKDSLLKSLAELIRSNGPDFLAKASLKQALKKLLEKAGAAGLGGPVGIAIDLAWPGSIARDPEEVLRDKTASPQERSKAIAVILGYPREVSNDASLLLILEALGYLKS